MKGIVDILTGHWIRGPSTIAKETVQLGLNKIVAKIYTSDTAFKYFSGAMKLPPNSPEAIGMFTRAIQIIGNEDQQKTKQPENPQ